MLGRVERKGEPNADTEVFFGLAFAKPFTEDGDLVMCSGVGSDRS